MLDSYLLLRRCVRKVSRGCCLQPESQGRRSLCREEGGPKQTLLPRLIAPRETLPAVPPAVPVTRPRATTLVAKHREKNRERPEHTLRLSTGHPGAADGAFSCRNGLANITLALLTKLGAENECFRRFWRPKPPAQPPAQPRPTKEIWLPAAAGRPCRNSDLAGSGRSPWLEQWTKSNEKHPRR